MTAAAYAVDDQSLLLPVYKRLLWDRITPRIPARVTPNTLTIIGQALGVVAAVACAIATHGVPILYVVSAFAMLASLTLDNVDGAHARRTGQCSRRGELLDHGLDGITSTCVLLVTGLVLQMSGALLAVFTAVGALTFAAVFWEQFRTGALSIPKIGPTEGVTAVAIAEVLVAVLGEPTWLRFSWDRVTVGTVLVGLVVVVHAVAVVPPFVRARKAGANPLELVPLFAVVAAELVFVARGADAMIAASAMGLACAHTTCHFIVVRQGGVGAPVVPLSLYAALAPAAVLPFASVADAADTAAATSLGIIAIGYLASLVRGWRLLGPRRA